MGTPVKRSRVEAVDGSRAVVRAFEAFCRHGTLTRAALAAELGASPSTVTGVVQALSARGFVAEAGTAASTGGRRARILGLAPALGSVLAADVGAINVRVAVADLTGAIIVRETMPTPASVRDELVAALTAVARRAPGPVLALTVAVAGIVDPDTRSVSFATVPGWPPGDPAAWLDVFGAPVLVENEANLAAVAEEARSGSSGAVLFVAVGAGIGAGLTIGGELYRGAGGSAGEIGLLRRSLTEPPHELEREAGAAAALRLYREAGGDPACTTVQEVFARAAAGDPAAATAVARVADELALGLANAIVVLDPERVVLGGGLGASGALLEPLRERIAELVPRLPAFAVSELGAEAALVGAAASAAQEAQRRLRARLVQTLRP